MKYMAPAMLPGVLCCMSLSDIYDLDFIFGALTSRRQVKLGHPNPPNRCTLFARVTNFNYIPR
jgi:hypothetical protein